METDANLTPGEIRQLEETYLFPTYKRYDLFVSHGSGPYIYDLEGRRYLDMLGGIAVNALGYNHPRITRVLEQQGRKVVHCSNLFYNQYQGLLAKRLCDLSGMSKAFFNNSGTEAIETALKIARAYARSRGNPDKSVVLGLKNAFHGRTFGALSVTAQEEYQAPFRPLVPDVDVIQEISIPALEKAFTSRVCAVILEPIQGEGGIFPIDVEFIRAARELCTRNDALLIMDEIQCGLGRTGTYFVFQRQGIAPDLIALAKSLAAGYPLGAVLGNARVAQSLKPGEHGTTFGGGPLACRLALEFLDILEQDALLERVASMGAYLIQGLERLAQSHNAVREIRGFGLMIGVELGLIAKPTVQKLLSRGFITNAAHETVLRLLPPFIIEKGQIDEFIANLDDVLSELED
jgi:acetylornithine/N-succinyldiaminopimelate aminotransferase